MSDTPFVSVVVATKNRAGLLAQTLDALAGQRWPRDRFEIVVADNDSTDATPAVVRQRAAATPASAIRYLHVPEQGKSAAVNRALDKAAGDLVALTDDDVVPDLDWVAAIAEAFEDGAIDFVAGRILPLWEAPPPGWMSPALYGVLAVPDNGVRPLVLDAGSSAVVPIGANMAVRRRLLDRIGGLRTDFGKLEGTLRTGEDHEWYLRMLATGFRGLYQPRAVVQHRVPAERLVRSYFRRWLHQNGRDVARLDREYGGTLRRWLGVPRYLWRQAAADLWAAVAAVATAKHARRFAATVRLLWFGGYVWETWFGSLSGTDERAVALEGGR